MARRSQKTQALTDRLRELRNLGTLDHKTMQAAENAVRSLKHAVAVGDRREAEKAMTRFIKAFTRGQGDNANPADRE